MIRKAGSATIPWRRNLNSRPGSILVRSCDFAAQESRYHHCRDEQVQRNRRARCPFQTAILSFAATFSSILHPMKILAFDTSLAACTVAAVSDGRIISERSEPRDRGHAEALMPMIVGVRQEAEVEYDGFDLIATTVGPGSFTGIRVAVAAARGMALATGVRAVGVTTTAALVQTVWATATSATSILAIIDARRAEAYAQLFDAEGACLVSRWQGPMLDSLANLAANLKEERGIVVGSGAAVFRQCLPDPSRWQDAGSFVPSGAAVAEAALASLNADREALPPAPLYLRPPDASHPRREGKR